MTESAIRFKNLDIVIKKLDTEEYEFMMIHGNLKYRGRSFLKKLSFIENLQEYADYVRPEIKYFDEKITICFPVPFSSKFELVQLDKPKTDENLELCIGRIEELSKELEFYKRKSEQKMVFFNFKIERGEPIIDKIDDLNIIIVDYKNIRIQCHNDFKLLDRVNIIQKKYNIQITEIWESWEARSDGLHNYTPHLPFCIGDNNNCQCRKMNRGSIVMRYVLDFECDYVRITNSHVFENSDFIYKRTFTSGGNCSVWIMQGYKK